MYVHDSNLGPLWQGHLRPCSLDLNKLGNEHQALLHTEFQASEPSGSEEEDFFMFYYVFPWFEPDTPWRGLS